MFIRLALLVFFLDQLIKFFVHRFMYPGQSFPIFKNFLHLTYVQNHGAAFGILSGWRLTLLLVGFAALILIVYINNHVKKRDFLHIPLAIILGGSLGNIFDRLFRSYVVDYIDFRFWPVFNLADIMINVGFFLVLVQIIRSKGDDFK
ncbi:signal peptidase II [candidate division WOR-1 bacterium RIFOXYA12_FULL_43_27]|uniref:Lipoprotein signal peptidase n=1 Tax=candidate division WOR-1 bacterium RIFOXYC2_FULL_46_14 TaxID=1802587 RepID=A0A1F4U5K2_UNCSA|nr:MAG: signal peptidase II [candidate division WOR-1 bacterium RIFOXYA12_FULL_43_27]OGC20335.1 MAG: signal peptidase II [candidate division WOR-1 bacterium RIFOXYB2_FULL_46_45]OGC31928.1 MAG: signal peptidase II [candidate division WOR-1 bacterium RIFOXYA2_FULL_46_56]OGC40181.1 MAG: signal peptidase II [candidate division WOR-1 bacterium RIFOXYC2_FULL_46_14]